MGAVQSDPLEGIRELVNRYLLGVPLGLLLRLAWPFTAEQNTRRLQAIVPTGVATVVLFGIETGQIFLPTRFPDPADVLMGVMGAALGSAMAAGLARRERTDEGFPPATRAEGACASLAAAEDQHRSAQRVLPIVGTEFNVRWYHRFSTVAFLVLSADFCCGSRDRPLGSRALGERPLVPEIVLLNQGY
jgi:hypothetical protein